MKIGIVGASGLVGRQILECLKERNIEAQLYLFASKRSAGTEIEGHVLQEIKKGCFKGLDVVFGATSNEVTKTWIDQAKEEGALIIDNSSLYRLDEDVPLVVPQINKNDIFLNKGIVSNPNCATIIGLMAVYPIYKEYGIKRLIVSTYQAVSGAGAGGIKELSEQVRDEAYPPKVFPYAIAFNLIPQIGDIDEFGISKEEAKFQNEGRKILHDENLRVQCTCVRVPVYRSHCESISIECEKEIDIKKIRELISHFPGDILVDEPGEKRYPMPKIAENKDEILVGRIRKDDSDPSGRSLALFCAGDQIRKGAATNAVEILEAYLESKK